LFDRLFHWNRSVRWCLRIMSAVFHLQLLASLAAVAPQGGASGAGCAAGRGSQSGPRKRVNKTKAKKKKKTETTICVVVSFFHLCHAAGEGSDGRTWQPYTDALVHATLLALPWGGHELMGDGTGPEVASLWEALEAYMAARPRTRQPGLAPFFSADAAADDYPAQ